MVYCLIVYLWSNREVLSDNLTIYFVGMCVTVLRQSDSYRASTKRQVHSETNCISCIHAGNVANHSTMKYVLFVVGCESRIQIMYVIVIFVCFRMFLLFAYVNHYRLMASRGYKSLLLQTSHSKLKQTCYRRLEMLPKQ